MGLLGRIFGTEENTAAQPDVHFGRYSDSYKAPSNYRAWDLALDAFEAEDYAESFRQFFIYLRDERENNVRCEMREDGLAFELFQGSRIITGLADGQKLKAEAKIAKATALNVGFMRRLIEKNFHLKYSKFALDPDNNITIVFDTFAIDGSPYKLYYALKELATNADKQDDLLLDEFSILQPLDASHIIPLPYEEKETKYTYFYDQTLSVLTELEKQEEARDTFPGGITYLLLNHIYKLDYLLKPEGYLMESLERIHRKYFEEDGLTTRQKNLGLKKELESLFKRSKEDYYKEFYRVVSTFGITNPVNHDRVVNFIDTELSNMDWYAENGYPSIALAIPGYIVGYCLFNFAVPRPDRELFHLYYHITEADYFQKLGFTEALYNPQNGSFQVKAIRKAIERIVDDNKQRFPNLNADLSILDFSGLIPFCKSYMLMIRNLDMIKLD